MRLKTNLQKRLWSIVTSLTLSATGGMPMTATAQTASDRAMLDMRDAFRKNDTRQLGAQLPRVQGHVLEPMAAYWELRARLSDATPQEIRSFLSRYSGTYYEDRLRNDWLLWLGRNGDWDNFNEELPRYRMNDDREVKCYALLSEHLRNGTDVSLAVRDLWLAQKEADDGCAAAARPLLKNRMLPAETAWKRARLGMESGRRKVVIQALDMLNGDWADTAAQIYEKPERYLDEKLTALRPRTRELVTLGLIRLATSNADAAIEHANKLRWKTQLTAEERSWVWGVIGKRAAQRLSDEAPDHFAHTQDHHLNDDMLAWKTRAALRAGAWDVVRSAIAAMSETQRKEAAWTYWQARALQALNTPEAKAQAQQLLQRMASSAEFYDQLALEAMGHSVTVPAAPAPLTVAEKEAALQNPGLQRALAAIALGLRSEGVREWNYTTNLHTPGGMGERELLAAADLACQREVWDRCINTSRRTNGEVDHNQRFPTPFRDSVVRRSKEIGLDPAYVYGLIRQESRFVTDARSGVGASGLMQVMPATAAWTAKKIGLTDFKPNQISDRETNIAIGTAYLKFALDDFEGSMPMAAAAYNAGPGRPRNWRNGPVLEAAIWIENIPFTETRDYVKNVLANTNNYAAALTGQAQKPSSRLAPIGPRAATAQASNRDLP
jgi:soluble lytic murein transglycosylase